MKATRRQVTKMNNSDSPSFDGDAGAAAASSFFTAAAAAAGGDPSLGLGSAAGAAGVGFVAVVSVVAAAAAVGAGTAEGGLGWKGNRSMLRDVHQTYEKHGKFLMLCAQ